LKNKIKLILVGLVVVLAWVFPAAAQEKPADNKWEFHIIPYLWMTGIKGDATVKGIEGDVDVTFGDIWDNLDFAGQVHMEVRKGRWGFFLDPTYLKLSSDEHVDRPIVGRIEADFTVTNWLVEFGGLYQLAKWPLGADEGTALFLDALGGGRYWYLKNELDLDVPLVGLGRKFKESEDWIDPFVGLRLRTELTKKLSLVLRGDVGGFGVGSDFTWNASAILGYHFSQTVSAWLGYRVLGVDYESGSGSSKFKYDVTMSGPMVGLGFSF
jgi:hypothetical protein